MGKKLNWLELVLITFGMAGLGAILGATLNSSGFITFRIPSWFPIAAFPLFFISGRLWYEKSQSSIRQRKVFNLTVLIVAILAVLSIPFLFWGVFMKLIHTASQGGAVL